MSRSPQRKRALTTEHLPDRNAPQGAPLRHVYLYCRSWSHQWNEAYRRFLTVSEYEDHYIFTAGIALDLDLNAVATMQANDPSTYYAILGRLQFVHAPAHLRAMTRGIVHSYFPQHLARNRDSDWPYRPDGIWTPVVPQRHGHYIEAHARLKKLETLADNRFEDSAVRALRDHGIGRQSQYFLAPSGEQTPHRLKMRRTSV